MDTRKRSRFSRRTALTISGTASAGLFLGTSLGRTKPRLPSNKYDFAWPQDNLDALMRIQADASGEVSFMYAKGRAYAALPGSLPQYMTDMQAVRANRIRQNNDSSYDHYYFVSVYIVDAESQDFLTEFKNPINGHVGRPSVRGAALLRMRHGYNGSRWVDPKLGVVNPKNPWSNNALDPFLLDWGAAGDVGWCFHHTPFVAQGVSWTDHNKWRFSLLDLENEMPSIPATFSFHGEGPYWRWTGLREGYQTYQMYGGKCARAKDIPRDILQNLERLHPEILDGPPVPT